MLKVAITGNIASGKSSVAEILIKEHYKVLDTDTVSHEILCFEDIKMQIKETFSDFDIADNNEISRIKLGKIVFANKGLRRKLEAIVHPLIKDEIARFFRDVEIINEKEQSDKPAFVLIPLLFETGFDDLFNKTVLIYSKDETRLKRLIDRNNISLEDAQNRLNSQANQEEKIALADYVLYNDGKIEDLELETKKMLKFLSE